MREVPRYGTAIYTNKRHCPKRLHEKYQSKKCPQAALSEWLPEPKVTALGNMYSVSGGHRGCHMVFLVNWANIHVLNATVAA